MTDGRSHSQKLRPRLFFGFLYPKQIVTLSMSQSHQIEILVAEPHRTV